MLVKYYVGKVRWEFVATDLKVLYQRMVSGKKVGKYRLSLS
jgi:hypothetical protein